MTIKTKGSCRMKNQLEILLIGLENTNMDSEKENLKEALLFVLEELQDIENKMKEKMIECIKNDDCITLNQIMQVKTVTIDSLKEELKETIGVSKYDNGQFKNTSKAKLVQKETVTRKKPCKFVLDGQVYLLEKKTWRYLIEVLANVLAEKAPKRFEEYMRIVNDENHSTFKFSKKKSDIEKDYAVPVYIKSVDTYMNFHDSARDLNELAHNMAGFFNLQDAFNIVLYE